MRSWFLVAVLILMALVPPSMARGAAGPVDTAAVDRFLTDYLARTALPGVAVAITRGTEVVHLAGYGHDSSGAAVTADTRMPIASVSKSFVALAVMQLVEAGQVELDAPVRRYLPEFRLADPRSDRITVRQLLTQTSGMSDTAFADLREPQAHNLTEAIERLRDAKMADEPGTDYHYHNPNFQVAARIVEVVGGMPFADYLRDRVFGPIGMADSSTVDTAREAKEVTHGYVRMFGVPVAMPEPDWFVGGSHGVVTTAADLARWLIVQNNGGVTAQGRRVVSPESIAVMHTPSPVESYGMGWRRDKPEEIFHTGDWFTYTAEQMLLPESGYGIAVLANTGLALEDDTTIIVKGLTELLQQRAPEVRRPWGVYADWVLAAAIVGTVGLAGYTATRGRRWATRHRARPAWQFALRLAPYLSPVLILLLLPTLSGFVFRGRSGTFTQVSYVWPALVLTLVVAAACGIAVLLVRVFQLIRLRRDAR